MPQRLELELERSSIFDFFREYSPLYLRPVFQLLFDAGNC